MAAFIWSCIFLTRITAQPPIPNPLIEYAEVFHGQTQDEVLARGFDCYSDSHARGYTFCIYRPVSELFDLISLTMQNHVVTGARFHVRGTALLVGDLPREWGRHHTQIIEQTVIVRWLSVTPNVNAQIAGGQFSFFSPVSVLSIQAS